MAVTNSPDHPLARATIVAALITLVGTVLGIVLGNRAGEKRASEEVQGLEARMRQQENAVQVLQAQLAERDKAIRELTNQVARERARAESAIRGSTNGAVMSTTMSEESQKAAPGIYRGFIQQLPVVEVRASSFRNDGWSYPPKRVINKEIGVNYDRSWESARGDLKGAWLDLYLPKERVVSRIRMYMVIDESSRGGQIRDAKLHFSDGTDQEVTFPFEQGWQSIDLTRVKTSVVRLEVLNVYPGNNGADNLEVAEIELYGE